MSKYIDSELSYRELQKSEARFLRKGILYSLLQVIAVIIAFQLGAIEKEIVTPMSLLMLIVAIVLCIVYWLLGRVSDGYRYVYLIRFILLSLVQASCLYLAYLSPTPFSFAAVLLFNVASGSILGTSRKMLSIYFCGVSIAWTFILLQRMNFSAQEFNYAIILYGSSIGLAMILHIVRRNTLYELVNARIKERERNQELEAAQIQMQLQKQQLTSTVYELERAKFSAEAASHAKSSFLAMISHEIRMPMNGVLGMTSLLTHSDPKPEQKEYIDIIHKSSESLLTIINDILDFSKAEADSLQLESVPFDLSGCIEDALDLFIPASLTKQIHLRYQIASDAPLWVMGDPTRLRQILVNLVGNAIKFTKQGEIFLQVEVDSKIADKTIFHFTVKDSGIGIPADKLAHLFQPFSQLDSSTTRKYGGTGLGLAISKRLSELMNGTMWVESDGQSGSVFHFTAELLECSLADCTAAQQAEQQRKGTLLDEVMPVFNRIFALQYPLQILLVEDNIVNQKVETKLLEQLGYQVDLACNGRDAVAVAEKRRYDLILMDIQMPEMDGLEATRRIREQATNCKPQIIAMTAGVLIEDLQIALDAGMNGYVSKPIHIKQLIEQLKACHHVLKTNAQSAKNLEILQSIDPQEMLDYQPLWQREEEGMQQSVLLLPSEVN